MFIKKVKIKNVRPMGVKTNNPAIRFFLRTFFIEARTMKGLAPPIRLQFAIYPNG